MTNQSLEEKIKPEELQESFNANTEAVKDYFNDYANEHKFAEKANQQTDKKIKPNELAGYFYFLNDTFIHTTKKFFRNYLTRHLSEDNSIDEDEIRDPIYRSIIPKDELEENSLDNFKYKNNRVRKENPNFKTDISPIPVYEQIVKKTPYRYGQKSKSFLTVEQDYEELTDKLTTLRKQTNRDKMPAEILNSITSNQYLPNMIHFPQETNDDKWKSKIEKEKANLKLPDYTICNLNQYITQKIFSDEPLNPEGRTSSINSLGGVINPVKSFDTINLRPSDIMKRRLQETTLYFHHRDPLYKKMKEENTTDDIENQKLLLKRSIISNNHSVEEHEEYLKKEKLDRNRITDLNLLPNKSEENKKYSINEAEFILHQLQEHENWLKDWLKDFQQTKLNKLTIP